MKYNIIDFSISNTMHPEVKTMMYQYASVNIIDNNDSKSICCEV